MRQSLIIAILALFLVAPVGLVSASNADDTPDCVAGQLNKIQAVDDEVEAASLKVCEGEHWNGADHTGSASECGDNTIIDPTDVSRVAFAYNHCGGTQDTNEQRADAFNNGATDALHLRVTCEGTGNACYVSAVIFGVGRANVATQKTENGGLAAIFLRDDSDQLTHNEVFPLANLGSCEVNFFACGQGNPLAYAVHLAGVTNGQGVGEEGENTPPCTQESYEGRDCTRDNTAATVSVN